MDEASHSCYTSSQRKEVIKQEREFYLDFIIKLSLPCIQPVQCRGVTARIHVYTTKDISSETISVFLWCCPKRISRWWRKWRHWSVPGKVLHFSLGRSCITAWEITKSWWTITKALLSLIRTYCCGCRCRKSLLQYSCSRSHSHSNHYQACWLLTAKGIG